MEISRLGHSSFKIRGKTATVVTDPFDPSAVGIKYPKVEADIVTVSHSHSDHNFTQNVSGSPYIISGPGEYEKLGVFVKGILSYHDNNQGQERGRNTIYRMEIDKIHLAHLGDLGHKLTDDQSDQLSDVDILFIPVGGFYTINSAQGAEIIAQIEPKIVIPMHYHEDRLNQQAFSKLTGLKEFFTQMGKEITILPKLTVAENKLPPELTVVALE